MPALGPIIQVIFAGQPIGRVLGLHVTRSCQANPAGPADQPFATSVQTHQPTARAELTLRDLPAVDGLALGASGRLEITIAPTEAEQAPRQIAIDSAVLVGQELQFAQDKLASARLTFLGQSPDGTTDPYSASEVHS